MADIASRPVSPKPWGIIATVLWALLALFFWGIASAVGLTLPPGGEELDWQDFVSNGPAGGRHLGRVVPKPHDVAATFAVVVPLVPR